MPKRKDLVGQTFSRLTVICLSDKKQGTSYLWECKCSCGNQEPVYALTNQLTSGHKRSCGCLHKDQIAELGKSKIKYKAGDILGSWKILNDSGKRTNDGRAIMTCECLKCGFKTDISSEGLRTLETAKLCPNCQRHNSKGEKAIIQLLRDNNIPFELEYSFKDLKGNGKPLRFDFFVNKEYLIEYDGRQHFKQGDGLWESLEEVQRRDDLKNKYCSVNKIPLIRIPYTQLNKIKIEDLLLETTNFRFEEVHKNE